MVKFDMVLHNVILKKSKKTGGLSRNLLKRLVIRNIPLKDIFNINQSTVIVNLTFDDFLKNISTFNNNDDNTIYELAHLLKENFEKIKSRDLLTI